MYFRDDIIVVVVVVVVLVVLVVLVVADSVSSRAVGR
jgi:hypothetical protein